ncbi:gamma-glutamyltransferase [Priestia megaterium]
MLQEKGIEAFYEGEIAEAIISTIKEHGGFMELSDLKEYEIKIDEPVWEIIKDTELLLLTCLVQEEPPCCKS